MSQVGDYNERIAKAERIVHAYGGVLASITPSVYGQPASLLPCSKDQIKQAIQLLLWEVGDANENLREGLIQGYVLLAQFIADHEAETLRRGQQILETTTPAAGDLELADQATRIVNRIKLEMETLMEEVLLFLNHAPDARGPDHFPGEASGED